MQSLSLFVFNPIKSLQQHIILEKKNYTSALHNLKFLLDNNVTLNKTIGQNERN